MRYRKFALKIWKINTEITVIIQNIDKWLEKNMLKCPEEAISNYRIMHGDKINTYDVEKFA